MQSSVPGNHPVISLGRTQMVTYKESFEYFVGFIYDCMVDLRDLGSFKSGKQYST